MSNIKALRQRETEVRNKLRSLHEKGIKEDRVLSAEEQAEWDQLKAKKDSIDVDLKREEELLVMERDAKGAEVDAEATAAPTNITVTERPKGGFSNFGEFLMATLRHERTGGRHTDQRLFAGATGAGEAVPSDGGFLVQKDLAAGIWKRMYSDGEILSRCTKLPLSSDANGIKYNAIDESSRVDGSRYGGAVVYWANEADTVTPGKIKTRQVESNLNKVMALYYATDEILKDAAALEAETNDAFSKELTFKVEEAFFNGNGSGQPLGILNSGAVIQATHDSGDSGATVTTLDILAMWKRLYAPNRKNAVWFINQDVESSLYSMTLGSGTAVRLLYTPPGENGNQYGVLLGRPVIPVEHCATLGTPGDIVLADMSEYRIIDKGAPNQQSSMHVRFVNDETAFRITYRVDGQTPWNKPLTPKNGSNTVSPFVILSTRS